MPISTYRITGTTGTIPETNGSLTGTLTTSSTDTTVYNYTGTDNLASIFPTGQVALSGYLYIYCAEAATVIAKVIGLSQLTATTWSIATDSDVTGATAAAAEYFNRPLVAYSYLNDGDSAILVDGVSVSAGTGLALPSPNISEICEGANYRPLFVNAADSDTFINVNTQ